MKAIIWAAGLGTRLRPLTENIPKAMVSIANRPMIEQAVDLCVRAGIEEVMINLHYFSDVITQHLGDGSRFGLKIHYSYEEELLENAGAVAKVKDFFNNEPFLAIASDNLADVNLHDLIDFHLDRKALVTIVTTKADDVSKYGIVASDPRGRVSVFQEKPTKEEAKGDQVATCIYAFSPDIFHYLPSHTQKAHFGKNIFPELIAKHEAIFAFQHGGYWNDIGHPSNYLRTNFDVLNNAVDMTIPYPEIRPNVYIGENVYIAPTARIIGPVIIGSRSHIGQHAVVGPYAVIGEHCVIEDHAQVERSVIWDHGIIEVFSNIWESILAKQTRIYKSNQIKNLVLGKGSLVNRTF